MAVTRSIPIYKYENDDDDDDDGGEPSSKRAKILTKKTVCLELCFKDSFRFLSESIDALCKNLDDDDFKNLKKIFSQDHALLKRKGKYFIFTISLLIFFTFKLSL